MVPGVAPESVPGAGVLPGAGVGVGAGSVLGVGWAVEPAPFSTVPRPPPTVTLVTVRPSIVVIADGSCTVRAGAPGSFTRAIPPWKSRRCRPCQS